MLLRGLESAEASWDLNQAPQSERPRSDHQATVVAENKLRISVRHHAHRPLRRQNPEC